jgi:hypothetical protein
MYGRRGRAVVRVLVLYALDSGTPAPLSINMGCVCSEDDAGERPRVDFQSAGRDLSAVRA